MTCNGNYLKMITIHNFYTYIHARVELQRNENRIEFQQQQKKKNRENKTKKKRFLNKTEL